MESKRQKLDLETCLITELLSLVEPEWRKITAENLNLQYAILLPQQIANNLLQFFENTIEYYSGDLAKVKVFGKWHQIPRQQTAYGDDGLKYNFSGITITPQPWNQTLKSIRDVINRITEFHFNFLLINKYRNGNDHIGEHRDDEVELDKNSPIASLSLGEKRDLVLKHKDARKGKNKRNIETVKVPLEHGSLLLMNPPTNQFWYHSLPPRKNVKNIRINLTFRKIITK